MEAAERTNMTDFIADSLALSPNWREKFFWRETGGHGP
jgi:hypothetical protein